MQEIDNLRAELNEIQTEIVVLVRRRLAVGLKIWQIKKANNLAFTDSKREQSLIHQFDGAISDPDEQAAVQNISKSLIGETKKYLEAKLK